MEKGRTNRKGVTILASFWNENGLENKGGAGRKTKGDEMMTKGRTCCAFGFLA